MSESELKRDGESTLMPGRISFDFRTNTMYPGEPTHDFQREHVTPYVRADLADALAEAALRSVAAFEEWDHFRGEVSVEMIHADRDLNNALVAYREGLKDG